MRVLASGVSGLIGSALVPALRARGHDVIRLVRREPQAADERHWDPSGGVLADDALDGVDAVITLSGASIDQRWTKAARERILASRVDSTGLLARAVAAADPKPALIAASAVGFYGDRGDEALDEESGKGEGFLSDVAAAWEAAAQPARDAGARTVHLRQAVVLSKDGGALARMLLPFRLGLGGRIGSGRQYLAWVALPDLLDAYRFALETDAEGVLNVAAPNAVTNREFTSTLGDVLRRPTVFPLPRPAVQVMFGRMGEEMLLAGQRVVPARLEAAGFAFAQPELEPALRAVLD